MRVLWCSTLLQKDMVLVGCLWTSRGCASAKTSSLCVMKSIRTCNLDSWSFATMFGGWCAARLYSLTEGHGKAGLARQDLCHIHSGPMLEHGFFHTYCDTHLQKDMKLVGYLWSPQGVLQPSSDWTPCRPMSLNARWSQHQNYGYGHTHGVYSLAEGHEVSGGVFGPPRGCFSQC